MSLFYDNTDSVTNSVVELTLTWPRDWTTGEVAELSLWFRGNSMNDVESLYLALSNTGGASSMVYHANPTVTQVNFWTEWRIPLQTFADMGIVLTDVNKIMLGFGSTGATSNDNSGLMYFNDFRLY